MYEVTLPDILPYPRIKNCDDNFWDGKYGHVIEPYGFSGLSVYIGLRSGHTFFRFADFNGNLVSVDDHEMVRKCEKLVEVLAAIKVFDACFYFSNNVLVDVMVSINKYLSPLMLKDLFSNIVKTQNIIDSIALNDDIKKKYKGYIFKPDRFKYIVEEDQVRPLYCILK